MTRSFGVVKMGRTAHCPSRKRALPSLPLGDANRGVYRRLAGSNRESPPHRPPERRAFPFLEPISGRFRAAAPYNPHGPVRSPGFPTVRALGRAAAAAVLLPAILRRGGAQEARRADTAREFESVSRVAEELTRSADVERVARTLLDELATLFDVGFAALTFVSDDSREASGYLARSRGEDVDWWRTMRLDLDREPSGIASAVFEATAFTVYDTEGSGAISARLVSAVGAKSAAFVPLLVEDRVTAVISVATLDEPRVFSGEDLKVMQTLASEAAVALERLRAGHCARRGAEAKRGAARAADRSAPGGARVEQRARPACGVAAAGRPARPAPRRRCRRLLSPRPRTRRLPLRRGAWFRRRAARLRVSDRPRSRRRCGARREAAGRERVRRDRGAGAAPGVRRVHRRHHRSDVLERRGAWRARRRAARGPPVRGSGTRASSRRSQVSRRSPCGTPRCSPRALGRRGSSAASTGSRRCSGSRCPGRRRSRRLPRLPRRRSEAARQRFSSPRAGASRPSGRTSCRRSSDRSSSSGRRSIMGRSSGQPPKGASSSRPPSPTTNGCCPTSVGLPLRRATSRFSPCRWTRRATPAGASCSSSSANSARSVTTISSSPAISPKRRAVRSSEASCSRASAVRALSRSS